MIRTHKTQFHTSKTNLQRLFDCNRESAWVWNDCLRIAKEYYLQHGKWLSKSALQKATKGRFRLHSQSIQAVCHKYLFARDSTHQARKQGITTARYPYKQKNHFNTKWAKQGFKCHPNGKIELSMGIHEGKRQPLIVLHVKELPQGDIKEIELIFDQQLMVAISYDDGQVESTTTGSNRAAIDPGEIHTIASYAETGESLIITGRKLRSIHRLRNKKLAELNRKLSRCQKGSRQWKRYQRAKRYVLSKSETQLKDALHKTTKNFVDWCLAQEVNEVVIGDVEGIQRNTRKSQMKNRGRKQNQRLSQWSFGKLYAYLEYKLNTNGMSIRKVSEAYSSQTCPVCGKRKKTSSRIYQCPCGYECHRDIHGAKNILSIALYQTFSDLPFKKDVTYLRVA